MSFSKYSSNDIVVSSDPITKGLWTGDQYTLTSFNTSSVQDTSEAGKFFLDVYQTSYVSVDAEVQFSLSYGHQYGSGSLKFNSLASPSSPTKVVYNQFRTLVYGDENTNFNFGSGDIRDVFIIAVNRNRYKEKLFPGTFNLVLSGSGTQKLSLTDNSVNITSVTYKDCGRVYDIVSGSNGVPSTVSIGTGITAGYTNSGSYGYFLPDVGLAILNARALALSQANGGIGLTVTEANDTANYNHRTLLTKMVSASANSEETISSSYIFTRIKNNEFNYSTNPTMISGSTGEIIFPTLVNSPQVYLTTIGLYNDNNELLAVAKMSKPLLKDFTKEALVRVKLDY